MVVGKATVERKPFLISQPPLSSLAHLPRSFSCLHWLLLSVGHRKQSHARHEGQNIYMCEFLSHPRPVSQLGCSQWKERLCFGGESMCFRLCFCYFPFSLLSLCTCGCVSDISTMVVCDVGLLHREEGSAP